MAIAPYDEPLESYEDKKAYEIATDEIKTLDSTYTCWVGEEYEDDTRELDYDEFLVFCEQIAKDNDVVDAYYQYRREDIVLSIDWDDDENFDE